MNPNELKREQIKAHLKALPISVKEIDCWNTGKAFGVPEFVIATILRELDGWTCFYSTHHLAPVSNSKFRRN